jgi:hypothetical protein
MGFLTRSLLTVGDEVYVAVQSFGRFLRLIDPGVEPIAVKTDDGWPTLYLAQSEEGWPELSLPLPSDAEFQQALSGVLRRGGLWRTGEPAEQSLDVYREALATLGPVREPKPGSLEVDHGSGRVTIRVGLRGHSEGHL